jgi:hypothetical protein
MSTSRYAKLVFLHPVGSADHVVHSGASVVQKVDALFYGWVRPVWIRQKAHWDTLHRAYVFCMQWHLQVT